MNIIFFDSINNPIVLCDNLSDIWIGNLDDSGQVLTEIRTEPYEFKQYDAQNVRTLLKEKETLENQLREIKSKLRDFNDGYFD